MLIDNTAWGSAKKGLLLTNKKIYTSRSEIRTIFCFPLNNVTIKNSKDLYINGKLFLKDPYAKESTMQDICKMLKEISKIVKESATKKKQNSNLKK